MQTLGADGHHLQFGCPETRFKTMLGAGLSEKDLKKHVLGDGEDKSSNKNKLVKECVLSWLSL